MNEAVRRYEYRLMMGAEALDRQLALGRERFRCCWARKADGHHGLCPVGRRRRRR